MGRAPRRGEAVGCHLQEDTPKRGWVANAEGSLGRGCSWSSRHKALRPPGAGTSWCERNPFGGSITAFLLPSLLASQSLVVCSPPGSITPQVGRALCCCSARWRLIAQRMPLTTVPATICELMSFPQAARGANPPGPTLNLASPAPSPLRQTAHLPTKLPGTARLAIDHAQDARRRRCRPCTFGWDRLRRRRLPSTLHHRRHRLWRRRARQLHLFRRWQRLWR